MKFCCYGVDNTTKELSDDPRLVAILNAIYINFFLLATKETVKELRR